MERFQKRGSFPSAVSLCDDDPSGSMGISLAV